MEKIKIGNTTFDVEYCKSKTADQIREIYNGEPKEVLDELIEKTGSKETKPIVKERKSKQNETLEN